MAEKSFTFTLHSNRPYVEKEVYNACERALEIMGGKAETYAKKECPVDTGRLRNSLTHTKASGELAEYVGTNVEYAPFVELGHHQEVGRYVPAIEARLVNSYVNGHPYLRPALEKHVSEYKDIAEKELNKVK